MANHTSNMVNLVRGNLKRESSSMIEAKCPKCGAYYCGWALLNPQHQMCSKCGTALDVYQNGLIIFKGYSPFTAEKYTISPPDNAPPSKQKKKDRVDKASDTTSETSST